MTTELTGDFEVDEEELDWDVFLPDPDEAEMVAEAEALEDEAELDLDDSHIDWETALNENENTEPEDGARAGAAYDRIVDMVRRSFEEPDAEAPAPAEADADAETEIDLAAVGASETLDAVPPEPDVEEAAPGADPLAQYEAEEDRLVERTPEDEHEPASPAFLFIPDADDEPMADMEPEEADAAPLPSAVLFASEPDLEPGSDVQSEPELEHFPSADEPVAAALAAALWTVDPEPSTPSEPEATWATRPPFEDPEDAGEAEPALEFLDADEPTVGEEEVDGKKPRSRVFTATLVLACVFLAVVAGAVAVRALHHATPAAVPPAHTTAPSHTAAPSHTTTPGAPSPSAARIQTATDAVDSATTAASVGLTSLSAFPTPTNVETVINPYISSLQLYETVLSGTKVPAAARPAATSAVAQLRQDITFLDTIDGLPPDQLGAYMVQFDTNATRLQTTLSTLEQNLRTTTP